jgi:Cu(I)/Ag(I) efflux system periplasmic protein CusF
MKKLAAAWFLAATLATPGFAQQSSGDHGAHHPAELSEGEVRKVDKQAKKITIRHGPLANLDMPAMTMVFQVKDPAMLDQVKTGDKVRFEAEKIGGGYAVTKIEPVR